MLDKSETWTIVFTKRQLHFSQTTHVGARSASVDVAVEILVTAAFDFYFVNTSSRRQEKLHVTFKGHTTEDMPLYDKFRLLVLAALERMCIHVS